MRYTSAEQAVLEFTKAVELVRTHNAVMLAQRCEFASKGSMEYGDEGIPTCVTEWRTMADFTPEERAKADAYALGGEDGACTPCVVKMAAFLAQKAAKKELRLVTNRVISLGKRLAPKPQEVKKP